MTTNGKGSRPIEGQALDAILKDLAIIDVTALSLKMDLEPLSDEDKAAGAEPLTPEQIQEELERISQTVARIVLVHLKAEPTEWYAVTNAIG